MKVSSKPNKMILMSLKSHLTFPERSMQPGSNLKADKTTGKTICQARMNRSDDATEHKANDDKEQLEETLASAQETLQTLRTLRR
ncbi:hypothetical protein AVEN_163037-1 [Araneus ventricosus]|uniref:Uncharacterized protein n=1 Tax=Araneus ventricosus TaxID=182803 RepID=A0A4Y2H3V8_ARAVE|nr:hypothetical protein AVEN_163037-1 [Araneus ventricosus]